MTDAADATKIARSVIENVQKAKGRTKANARHALFAEAAATRLGALIWGYWRELEEKDREIARLENELKTWRASRCGAKRTDGALVE